MCITKQVGACFSQWDVLSKFLLFSMLRKKLNTDANVNRLLLSVFQWKERVIF